MNQLDKQRIENAAWILFQYQDDVENMASELKLDRCELESMFRTLHYVSAAVCEEEINNG